mgnify:CR=1 FL=1
MSLAQDPERVDRMIYKSRLIRTGAELISFIEKRFGIELRDEALNLQTFRNLRSVARVIEEQLAEQRA